jgi:casein kinase II subunit beta
LGAQAASKVERVRPRIFGFQVHEHARLLRWQEKIRDQ